MSNTNVEIMNKGIMEVRNPNRDSGIYYYPTASREEIPHMDPIVVPPQNTRGFEKELMVPAPCEFWLKSTSPQTEILHFEFGELDSEFVIIPIGDAEQLNPSVIKHETGNNDVFEISLGRGQTGIIIVGTVDIADG